MRLTYSFIVPVYNRPDEVAELLESFIHLSGNIPFEVVLVEDGSSVTSKEIVNRYTEKLNISYWYKKNTGPGDSRNFGMQHAKGNYFIILDSDVVLPTQYLEVVNEFLQVNYIDCFGGPDAATTNFSAIQKAINFTMTSLLTTGGIRGKEKAVKNFEPRSFNMGISKKAFEVSGGYGTIHPGEDPDLSIRIKEKGFSTGFIRQAFVYHKRRISWKKFYKQVYKFGLVRPIITTWHPHTASIVFWFPSLFSLGFIASIIGGIFRWYPLAIVYIVYFLLIVIVSAIQNKSLSIGVLSLWATLTQFFGYGFGFLKSTCYIRLQNKNPKTVFPNLFFNS